jgi:hypothetical protein
MNSAVCRPFVTGQPRHDLPGLPQHFLAQFVRLDNLGIGSQPMWRRQRYARWR